MNIDITPEQLLYDSAVVPTGEGPRLHPWRNPLPPVLYKYYPPERFHVLTDCMVRFSQRQVFDDEYDLRPEVGSWGSEQEIRAFMASDPVLCQFPEAQKSAVIQHVLTTPGAEKRLIQQTQGWLTTPEEYAVFCLCENHLSRDMWNRYAGQRKGFLVAFNTRHPGFDLLSHPGRIGKVDYSDKPISSFLSKYGGSAFFRKRERYRFEAEWRSVRAIRRFKNVRQPERGLPLYLAPFCPACVDTFEIMPECAVEWELRTLAAVDARYRHTRVLTIDRRSLE